MSKKPFSCLLLFVCLICARANSQIPYQLSFEYSPATAQTPPVYSWNSGTFPVTITSPGGTSIFFAGRADFNSFDDFREDVIGQWQIDAAPVSGSFELLVVLESDFPKVELISPVDGDRYLSGSIIQVEISPDNFPSTGTSVQANPAELEVNFPAPMQVQFDLLPNHHHSVPLVSGRGGYVNNGLLSEIHDGALPFEISPNVSIRGNTIRAAVTIFIPLPGDVNQDGMVSLLDIAPFIELVISGTYLEEADLNGDGVVNLFDVAPFVEALI